MRAAASRTGGGIAVHLGVLQPVADVRRPRVEIHQPAVAHDAEALRGSPSCSWIFGSPGSS
jgi:hypothetical protein